MFLIYPSLPGNDDLNLLLDAAAVAWEEKRGAWAAFGEDLLLGYEFRAAVKLGVKKLQDPAAAIADAYQWLCVDLRDLRLVGKFDYFQVPPSQWLWIWEVDLAQAKLDLALPDQWIVVRTFSTSSRGGSATSWAAGGPAPSIPPPPPLGRRPGQA
jgi:hypothetical protein